MHHNDLFRYCSEFSFIYANEYYVAWHINIKPEWNILSEKSNSLPLHFIYHGFSGQAIEPLSAGAANGEESSLKKESDGMFELLLCHLQGKFQVDSYYSPGDALWPFTFSPTGRECAGETADISATVALEKVKLSGNYAWIQYHCCLHLFLFL
jgi:hypothetical protein